MVQRGHIEAGTMTGSWAGAMGQTQFMPSSYLKYAVDFDGDERRDIWKSTPDTLASMANYLKGFGWKRDETWGREVHGQRRRARRDRRIDPEAHRGLLRAAQHDRARPLAEWQKLGVRRVDGGPLPKANVHAGLVDVGERTVPRLSELRRHPRLQLRALLRADGGSSRRSTGRQRLHREHATLKRRC